MINLWNPHVSSVGLILVTSFLLGIVHGLTPDEHTWPITFSYAIGSYSTRRGLRAGLLFSLAFTVQRALASELAYWGLAHLFTSDSSLGYVVYVIVGIVMAWAGWALVRGPHRLFLHLHPHLEFDETRPWMPLVHGFIAGWGFGAFALIIYTTLAPAMPSSMWAWVPGALFGLGTTLVQATAGAGFGYWLARKKKLYDVSKIRRIGLMTASRTLQLGGLAFVAAGVLGLVFPRLANRSVDTGIRIHNLHTIGLPFFLVIVVVLGIGLRSLHQAIRIVTATPTGSPSKPRATS